MSRPLPTVDLLPEAARPRQAAFGLQREAGASCEACGEAVAVGSTVVAIPVASGPPMVLHTRCASALRAALKEE